jgi:hypothetical protein
MRDSDHRHTLDLVAGNVKYNIVGLDAAPECSYFVPDLAEAEPDAKQAFLQRSERKE